jgi:PHD/YefM family antitoxin component YafN of YafNO toxin-antitoxin module
LQAFPTPREIRIVKETIKVISLRVAQETLENPESFRGGVYVTKNGAPELFITTAAERAHELAEQQDREQKALVKLVSLAIQDIAAGKTYTVDEALKRLRETRA